LRTAVLLAVVIVVELFAQIEKAFPKGRIILPIQGDLAHDVVVFVRILKVVRELVIHHAAGNEAVSVKVIEGFVLTEITHQVQVQ
jgi:hypothetical protein